MRAARLIKMVLLLQGQGSMTAARLATELEVSERTVSRDVLALSEAGVPVYADRGRAGGYRLIGGYRTRLTGMARTEAEALFLSGVPSALREMGIEDVASAARLKVSAALLPELADAQTTAAQRFHLDAPGWWQEPETPPLLAPVAEAVWGDRRIEVRYRRRDGEVTRRLEPYGLVLKAGVWYVAARVADPPDGPERTSVPERTDRRDGFRVYRVDRLTAVSEPDGSDEPDGLGGPEPGHTSRRFARDEFFDLSAFWAERAAAFARSLLREEVTVRLSEAGARRLRYATDREAADEAVRTGVPGPDGWLTVTLPVESLEVAYDQLLALGPECEVLRPRGLRERFRRAAARTLELYAEPEGRSGR
ncbi:helix-turn-helix transcriptional regulator [Streptomyces oceani]|uniref:Transcriptional regulator n=1 Tax=Streptomyces oceani TaxID=1075402 RepID=A0A1E7KCS4_9ACTN|nr:WYL domain-containing protein [Streptomyces oceani]OEV01712.1 transcriptional regulator [Streptomyces oceani]